MTISLSNVGSGFKRTAINSNFDTIESEINNNVLTKDGGTQLEADLDMNSNKLINLADGTNNKDAVTLEQLNEAISAAGSGLIASQTETQKGSSAVNRVFTFAGITYTVGGNNLFAFQNGQKLIKGRDYTETTSSTITLDASRPLNDNDDFDFITNLATTNTTADTSGITHTEDATTYNLTTYLQNRHVVYAADWSGIDTTGITDSTAAFGTMLSYARTNNLPIVLSGTIRIDSTISNFGNNTAIYGLNPYGNQANTDVMATIDWRGTGNLFSDPGAPASNCTFQNFAIDVTNNTNANHDMAYFSSGLRWSNFRDISLQGVNANTRHGIWLDCSSSSSSYHVDLDNITSWGTAFASGAMIRIEGGAAGFRYNDVAVNGGDVYNFLEGVRVINSHRTSIQNTYFAQNDNGNPPNKYGVRFSGDLNKEHLILNPKFEPDCDIHIQIDQDDNVDGQNLGLFIGANISPGLVVDSVTLATDRYRYTLFSSETRGLTLIKNKATRPLKITADNAGSSSTPGTTADELQIDSNTHAGITVTGPETNIQQWYAFGHENDGQYGGIRGRPDTEEVQLWANDAEKIRIDGTSTAGDTGMMLWDVDNATLERVTVGAADSGGTGYKVLRIPN